MFNFGDGPAFAFALLALCPLAERLGYVTEKWPSTRRNWRFIERDGGERE